jgi:hypothetical protein
MNDEDRDALEQKINELISPHIQDYKGPTPIYRWLDAGNRISVMPHFIVHLPLNVSMKLIMLIKDYKDDGMTKNEY